MLDPTPGRTANFPKPIKLLSPEKLRAAWRKSRDATVDPARPGIDGVTAQTFAANLDSNLRDTSQRIRTGQYGPSRLKVVFIPKPNSSKERMICIPTVRDRVVQRAIVDYLVTTKRLPIYNSSSYGFIKGSGPQPAIQRATSLRTTDNWCLKTDIEAFFDRIPRQQLKDKIGAALPQHSLVPLIWKIVDCDIKTSPSIRLKLQKYGVRIGVGVRQGMPLSPILANLVLAKFDRAIERAGIQMIRYADDMLLFFRSKSDLIKGHDFIRKKLSELDLMIPEIADKSKTQVIGPCEPVDFLGREIVYLGSEAKFVARVPRKQIDTIRAQLEAEYTFQNQLDEDNDFQDAVVELWKSVSAYLGIYKDAHNFILLDSQLRTAARKVISDMFLDIFGDDALARVTPDGKRFLGISKLDVPPPVDDLEV